MSDELADAAITESPEAPTISVAGRTLTLHRALGVVTVLLLLIAPFVAGTFYMRLLTEALIFTVFAIGVDLIWGYTGIMTFGHAVFFGIGAYGMAKIFEIGVGSGVTATYLGLLVCTVLAGLMGLVVAGIMFYRGIRGGYFTIITLALAIVASEIATTWTSFTGGFNGITISTIAKIGIPGVVTVELLGLPMYLVVVAAAIGTYLLARRIVRSPLGTTVVAINENVTKARAMGYNVEKYKMLIFAIGSAMAGFSGALYASFQGFVSPPLLGFLLSTEVLIWILIGGRGTLVGAAIGTVFLKLFESFVSGVFQFSWNLILGVTLVVIVLRYPDGIVGIAKTAWQRVQTYRKEGQRK